MVIQYCPLLMNTISHIFDLLDQWRHLPDYQLERRADIFFAAYLPAFLSQRSDVEIHPLLVPEFPVRIGTIYPDVPINKSFKIDYVAFARDISQAWLVELKTDSGSRRDKQDKYLKAAQGVGLPALIDGVLQIVEATNHKHKYCCLLRLLERIGLLALPDDLGDALASRHWSTAVNACLPRVEVAAHDPPLQIVYLQPMSAGPDEVGFEELAAWLAQQDDAVARRFASSLRDWGRIEAGRRSSSGS